jgi:hypothetical protein
MTATRAADITAVSVNVLAGWTWIEEVNDVLQLVLTVAGIVAAIAAARYHIVRTRRMKNDSRED